MFLCLRNGICNLNVFVYSVQHCGPCGNVKCFINKAGLDWIGLDWIMQYIYKSFTLRYISHCV